MKDEEFGIIDWKLTTPDGEIIGSGKGGRVGTDLSGPPLSPIIQIIKVKYEGREYINERASDGMHYVNIAPTFELVALCDDGSLWQGFYNYVDQKMTWQQISPPQAEPQESTLTQDRTVVPHDPRYDAGDILSSIVAWLLIGLVSIGSAGGVYYWITQMLGNK